MANCRHRTKDGRELTVESRIVLETLAGRRLALESTRDVTERKPWEERQNMLLGELTHRVKNTLAVVQAIAHQSLRSRSNEDFIERFDGRLAALAAGPLIWSIRIGRAPISPRWRAASSSPISSENPDRVKIKGDPSPCRRSCNALRSGVA